jgi:hypothetical protein
LKFYVANIAHDGYLGQPWLTSNGIVISWTFGNVCVKSDITIHSIWKKERELNMISACQFKKAMKNNQAFIGIICPQEPEDKPLPLNPKVQDLLNEYANVFSDELPKNLPPE